jgi:hypothetical protein
MKVFLRKNLTLALIGLCSLFLAGQAQALTVGEVGDLDVYTGDYTYLMTPTEQDEVDWINTVLGTDYTTVIKTEIDTDGVFEEVIEDPDIADTWAIAIAPADYFIIKIFDSGTDPNVFLFENNSETDYAYIDLTAFNEAIASLGVQLSDIESISHVASPVPVPAAVWLFGSALLGLVGVARRQSQA